MLPHLASLVIEGLLDRGPSVVLQVRLPRDEATCGCGVTSRRVHSRYWRHLADAPIAGRPVELRLRVRRFFCDNTGCPARTSAPFDLEELLVAQRDVLGGQVRVGRAEQVLPVELGVGGDLGGVDAEQPARGDAQEPVQAGLGGDHSAQLGPARRRQLIRPGDHRFESFDEVRAHDGVAVRGVGVAADHEPLGLGDLDLLDPQVRAHLLVAALAGHRRDCFGRPGSQLLAQDVAAPAGG
ncbi:transposase family protein [Pseudonocardia sp. EV170527-09]|nr:transposase family protein [Pseudonocardia sp. EV170527-09]